MTHLLGNQNLRYARLIVIIRRECNLLTFVQTWDNYKGPNGKLDVQQYDRFVM